MKTSGQIVLPVFYRVDPTDVQELRGNFGEAFSKHKKEVKILEGWRHALIEISNLAGWDSRNIRFESELVEKIVNVVLEKLNHIFKCDYKNDDLVGIEWRVRKMESLLFSEPINDRRVVGVWGMGGIGKTTLAEEVFHRIKEKFDGHYFVANVREEIMKQTPNALRDKIFCQLLGEKDGYIDTPRLTIRRLQSKKVILVFDDVVNPNDLKLLVGVCDLCSKGSRIIITSRDRQTLKNVCLEEHIYEVKELIDREALRLFSLYAFKQDHPKEGYEKLSEMAIRYAQGSLSRLIDKSLITISSSNGIGMHDLLQQMGFEIVYKESEQPEKRSRLLNYEHICCVLTKETGTENVEGISLNMSEVNDNLVLKSTAFQKMYNLRILKFFNDSNSSRGQLQLPSGLEFLPEGLRYLHWDRYPLNYLPLKCCTKYLVELRMPLSNLSDLWNGDEALGNLKLLDLTNSLKLTRVPELSRFPNLEVLRLGGCISLIEIPSSIGELKCLKDINLNRCSKLHSIPQSISNLKSLTVLNMSQCLNVTELPENIGDLEFLETLYIFHSGIKALPSSINQLENLVSLSCIGCKGLTLPPLTGLSRLQRMTLDDCGIIEIPQSLGLLVSLTSLSLTENNFESIPASIKQLSELIQLYLFGCKRLKCLPELPSGLRKLSLGNCTSLKCLPELPSCLIDLSLGNCTSLESASTSFLVPEHKDEDRIENFLRIEKFLDFSNCFSLDKEKVMKDVLKTHLLKHKIVRLCIPGDEVPQRMRYKNQSGSSLSFTLDQPNLIGVSLCLVFDPKNYYGHYVRFNCEAQFIDKSGHNSKNSKFSFQRHWITDPLESEHVYLWNDLFYISDRFAKAKFEFFIEEASFQYYIEHFSLKPQHNSGAIIKCGVLPIFRDDFLCRDKKRSRNQEDEEEEPSPLKLKRDQTPYNSTTATAESH
ncbi:disease resistance-like protein DSC1 isoform X2 [Hevea brasiliensis]|uniref:disease resistance-like protein DSC1 isoform X2 n=1 Tax=Hevea brasiliensis TaxID=3981 RepID=UPI0025D0B57A|nr:disease resistance-like protein DSC1 isoform X2 [Hevea brasiliensis]